MKIIHSMLPYLITLVLGNVYGQTNTFPTSGNVGIGTLIPSSALDVHGTIKSNISILVSNPENSQATVSLGWKDNVARLRVGGNGIGYHNGFDIQTVADVSLMRVLHNGNVGLGTPSPTHKLEVNGTVRAKEIKLEATNWPDYVFEKGYDLMSLEEVKAHIDQKGHLPGLKSAKEYEAEGVNIMELNQKLLEKIEELTLYQIELLSRVKLLESKSK